MSETIEQIFPDELRNEFLGSKWSCQICEGRFEVKENKPNGKKSRTWILGHLVWGKADIKTCLAFIVKCPSCDQPIFTVVCSKRERLEEAIEQEQAASSSTTPRSSATSTMKPVLVKKEEGK